MLNRTNFSVLKDATLNNVIVSNASNLANLQVSGVSTGVGPALNRRLTATEISDSYSTPIELIPAAGPNTFIYVTSIGTIYKYDTQAFTGGSVELYYSGSDMVATRSANAIGMDQTSDLITTLNKSSSFTLSADINKPIIFTTSDQFTGGGQSTLSLVINYYVIDM